MLVVLLSGAVEPYMLETIAPEPVPVMVNIMWLWYASRLTTVHMRAGGRYLES